MTKFIWSDWPAKLSKNDQSEFSSYFKQRLQMFVNHGCIFRGEQVVIPSSLRQRILSIIHDAHQGIVKMKRLARSYFWWPTMKKNRGRRIKIRRMSSTR